MTGPATDRWFEYRLEPLARVSAGKAGAVQNRRRVHDVVPGTVVRGALGGIFWSAAGVDALGGAARAQQIFDVVFRYAMTVQHAVPFQWVPSADADGPELRPAVELIGTTRVRCKYRDHHLGWHDTAAQPLDRERCPKCQGGLARGKGWSRTGASITVAATRTALSADGTATDAQLFTREALRRDLVLCGLLRIRSEHADLADDLQAWLRSVRQLSVGGQRSTLGRCTLSVSEVEAPVRPTASGLILRLASPAILVDGLGAPSTRLGEQVAALLSAAGSGTRVEAPESWTRPTSVSGWHGMAGVPKAEEVAVEAGSSVLLVDVDAAALSALDRGVGIRRSEGYGVVDLLDPATQPVVLTGAADAPPVVTLEPPPEPHPGREAVDALAIALSREDRSTVLRGLATHARGVKRWRGNGFPESVIAANFVTPLTSQPWMRALSGPVREQIVGVLTLPSAHLDDAVRRIEQTLTEEP